MKRVGIIPNKFKDKDFRIAEQIAVGLQNAGLEVYAMEEVAKALQTKVDILEGSNLYRECDCVIAIGGDGTILSVAEDACIRNVPIIGVNLGRLGFLADIEVQEMEEAFKKILRDEYTIDERMMLRATVTGPGEDVQVFHALNDINVTRGSFARIVDFQISVNQDLCDIYPADGIIISTPTGSTAYNLSAGGPIVLPGANTYVITPICPHTLYSKSVVVSKEDIVEIRTLEDQDKTMALSIDGKLKMYLTPQHVIKIEKSPYVTRLIKCSERKFFDILRNKMVERRR